MALHPVHAAILARLLGQRNPFSSPGALPLPIGPGPFPGWPPPPGWNPPQSNYPPRGYPGGYDLFPVPKAQVQAMVPGTQPMYSYYQPWSNVRLTQNEYGPPAPQRTGYGPEAFT